MMKSKNRKALAFVATSSVLIGGGFLLAANTYATPTPTPTPSTASVTTSGSTVTAP